MNLQNEVLFFHPLQINISEVFRIFRVTVNCLRFLLFFYHDSFMIPLTKKNPPLKIDKPFPLGIFQIENSFFLHFIFFVLKIHFFFKF